ncbi:MAG: hypothetical protein ACSHWU_04065 [Marinicella sp.]
MKNTLLILIWLSLIFVSARFVPSWRSQNSYIDLLPVSAQQVLQQQENVAVDIFALPNSPAANLVDNFLQPLVQSIPYVEINYIDINQNPELVQQHQINKQGEMVVHVDEQSFHLTTLSYEAFFNGLKRLSQPADQWMVFLEEMSSRSFDGDQPNGMSDWVKSLKVANYHSIVLSWNRRLELPKQAKVIVLTSPANNLTVDQFNWLETQISRGISLLWLADPQTADKQPALSLMFDVMRTSAFHAGHLIVKDFPKHPINQAFDRPLDLVDVMPFDTANTPIWLNEQNQTLAAIQEVGESRLMVIGDSDFLSNAFLYSGGNLEMSFRLVDWLLHHDDRIDLPTIGTNQAQLHYRKSEILWFSAIMLIMVPLLLIMIGIYYWRKTK